MTEYYRTPGGWVLALDPPLSEDMQHQVSRGELVRVADADGNPVGDEPALVQPAKTASKADWVGYARRVDPGLSVDDADAMTRADLIEKYGK